MNTRKTNFIVTEILQNTTKKFNASKRFKYLKQYLTNDVVTFYLIFKL